MAAPRITKAQNFAELRGIVEMSLETEAIDAEEATRLTGFIDHEVELLTRKTSAKAGPTKDQRINEGIKVDILAAVTGAEGGLRSAEVAELMDISVQKSTALLKQLVESGEVVRSTAGKVTTFSAPVAA